MTDKDPRPLIQVDTRSRASLGKDVAPPGSMFLVEVDPSGVIRLVPAVVVPLGADGKIDIGSLALDG